ncbi:MAG: hypothetical protein FJ098_14655 [Deltaproteobacteria bacterium]|nr:hypothetical protein [Deltaproteobacteria bacterium]
MRQSRLLLLTMVMASCGPAHTRDIGPGPRGAELTRPPAAVEPSPPGDVQLFLVLPLDGDLYVQLDGQAFMDLDPPVMNPAAAALVESPAAGYVLRSPLDPAEAADVGARVRALGPLTVFDGGVAICTATPDAPVAVARDVPHFGMEQDWTEAGVDPAGANGLPAREALIAQAATFRMARLPGCRAEGRGLWARTHSERELPVLSFLEASAEVTDDLWERTFALDAWNEARARVMENYEEAGSGEPDVVFRSFEARPGEDADGGWAFFCSVFGDGSCGGPGEARLVVLWRQGPPSTMAFWVVDPEEETPFEVSMIGDADGDGHVEILAFTSPLDDRWTLFRLVDGALVPLVSSYTAYNDCPC